MALLQQKPKIEEKKQDEIEKFFKVEGDLKKRMDRYDRLNIRTQFKQASDPIYLAFNYLDKKPLNKVVQDVAKETVLDFCTFISKVFVS